MNRLLVSTAPAVLAAGLLVGCSGSSNVANKAKFCQDNATIDKAASGATSADEALQALKPKQSVIDDFGKTAPSAIKADAQTLVTGVKAAFKANNSAGFNDPNFIAAGQRADAFCGQDSNGNPIGSTSSTS